MRKIDYTTTDDGNTVLIIRNDGRILNNARLKTQEAVNEAIFFPGKELINKSELLINEWESIKIQITSVRDSCRTLGMRNIHFAGMNDMYIFLQSYAGDDTLVLDVQRIKNQITELSNQLDEFLGRLEILIHEISTELETDLMNLHNNDFKTDINRANIGFKLSGKNNQLKTILSDTQRLKS